MTPCFKSVYEVPSGFVSGYFSHISLGQRLKHCCVFGHLGVLTQAGAQSWVIRHPFPQRVQTQRQPNLCLFRNHPPPPYTHTHTGGHRSQAPEISQGHALALLSGHLASWLVSKEASCYLPKFNDHIALLCLLQGLIKRLMLKQRFCIRTAFEEAL